MSFALHAIRKEGLELKPVQLQAICHVYEGKDFVVAYRVWQVSVLRDVPLCVQPQGTKQY